MVASCSGAEAKGLRVSVRMHHWSMESGRRGFLFSAPAVSMATMRKASWLVLSLAGALVAAGCSSDSDGLLLDGGGDDDGGLLGGDGTGGSGGKGGDAG